MSNTPRFGVHYGSTPPEIPERGGRLPVALAFPGPESLALSTLGWQAVYRLLAARSEFAVERFYAPAPGQAPRSADTGAPLSDFPLVLLSLNFEEEYLDALRLLDAAGVPTRRAQRGDWPLVLAGGPLPWMNPAPTAEIADLVWIGEAEGGLAELLVELKAHFYAGGGKAEWLAANAARPGVYVPGLSPLPVTAARAPSPSDRLLADPAHSCFVSPRAEFADMLLLEVNRGCPYGCRFCAAGFLYRPPRRAAEDALKAVVEEFRPGKVGLVGTALTDWPRLLPFLEWLKERGVKFSLSSIRADGVTRELLEFLRRAGVRTLTLALEAPSRRLRRAANKKLDEADFLNAVRLAAEFQFNHLKSYMIVGWPGETDADYAELGEFLGQLEQARGEGRGGRKKGLELVTLSVSPLVPKPWTPFQWAAVAPAEAVERRIAQVKAAAKPIKGLKVTGDSVFASRLQALLSRGGAEIIQLAELALAEGGWRRALKTWDRDLGAEIERERGEDEPFPWEVADIGVSRAFLWREWQRYHKALATPACPAEGCGPCPGCGLARREGGGPAAG